MPLYDEENHHCLLFLLFLFFVNKTSEIMQDNKYILTKKDNFHN